MKNGPRKEKKENRKNTRYATAVKVYFHFPYELESKVDYRLTDKDHKEQLSPTYSGLSKNVSAEGLCFNSGQELKKNDNLHIELQLPGDKSYVSMEGVVRWCLPAQKRPGYDTGVQLQSVNGKSIRESIYFDEKYQVEWSALLEAILGKFRVLAQKRKH
jgi:hypothetical protein